MSFRSKTLKAEKFGTPVTPTITTPKEPSPKEPQIIKTIPQVVVTGTKVSSKIHPRTAISFGVTPTQEGIKAQQSFTQKLYSVTVPIKNEIDSLKNQLVYYTSGDYLRDPTRTGQTIQHNNLMVVNLTDQINTKEDEIDTIVEEIINVELQANVSQIIQAIESGKVLAPDYFHNNIAWVKDGSISQQEFLDTYYTLSHQGIIHTPLVEPEPEPTPELEIKETWWVIRPSGIIEQLTVTQKFVDTMTAQGWIFSKEKPTIEEPQNQNISIVFHIGKGGDLKTHFGINSIIVTPDEAEQLAKWLFQHYNTKILFVMNRLTDDIRTHTLQQIKDLIVQKLKDDKPDSDDIDDDDIKKPQELGFMGAGIAGAIAGLVLIGFIADHKRGK